MDLRKHAYNIQLLFYELFQSYPSLGRFQTEIRNKAVFFLQAECHSCNLPKQTQTTDSDQRKPPTGLILPKQHSLEQLLNFYSIIINDKKINATPDLVTIALHIPGHNVQT